MTRIWVVLFTLLMAAAACRSDTPAPPEPAEPPAIAVTKWSGKTELFMEYPPLVAGEQARFAIHLTDIASFRPIREGRVVVRFEGETIERFEVEGPSTPGIFGVDVKVPAARRYQIVVELHGPISDEHRVGAATVFADAKSALAAQPGEEEAAISFLKEQQWTLEFATAVVDQHVRRAGITAPAMIQPRAGGEADVRAPVAGRVAAASSRAIGTPITRGATLVELVARSERTGERPVVRLELSQAETAHRLAQENLARVERLVRGGAAPQRRLDEARAEEQTAAARVQKAKEELRHLELTRLGAGAGAAGERVVIRAPISGILVEANTTAGANVDDGQLLFKIVALDRVHVVGAVSEQHLAQVHGIKEAELLVPGMIGPIKAGRLIATGRVVNPETRAVAVTFELAQPPAAVAIGQAVTLRLLAPPQGREVSIPAAAVVDDGGQSIVFVQAGGESFERRPVKLGGAREGGFVHVAEGVQPGERVVTRGAHLVRLAALSPRTPGHGHVH